MAVKSVFSYLEGNKNKKCTLIGEFTDGNLWVVDNEFSICLESEGVLYRIGHVGEGSMVGGEYVTVLSPKSTEKYTSKASEGTLISCLHDVCKSGVSEVNRRYKEALISDDRSAPMPVNVNFYACVNRMPQYDYIVSVNDKIRAIKDAAEAERINEQSKKLEAQRVEARADLISRVRLDDGIDSEELVALADELNVKIPLRTRGWILAKMGTVKSSSMSWYRQKRTDRASDKVIPIYKQVREALLTQEK